MPGFWERLLSHFVPINSKLDVTIPSSSTSANVQDYKTPSFSPLSGAVVDTITITITITTTSVDPMLHCSAPAMLVQHESAWRYLQSLNLNRHTYIFHACLSTTPSLSQQHQHHRVTKSAWARVSSVPSPTLPQLLCCKIHTTKLQNPQYTIAKSILHNCKLFTAPLQNRFQTWFQNRWCTIALHIAGSTVCILQRSPHSKINTARYTLHKFALHTTWSFVLSMTHQITHTEYLHCKLQADIQSIKQCTLHSEVCS